jgi:hypothetical protein
MNWIPFKLEVEALAEGPVTSEAVMLPAKVFRSYQGIKYFSHNNAGYKNVTLGKLHDPSKFKK